MYQVTVIDTKVRNNQPRILITRLYNHFQNAFSDIIYQSDIHDYLSDIGRGVTAGKPELIIPTGIKTNGYGDDFRFRYSNGIIIAIGEIIINDEEKNNE